MAKTNKNPEMPEINRKLFNNKIHPLLTVSNNRRLLKNYQFGIKNNQHYFHYYAYIDKLEQYFESCTQVLFK